MITLDEAQAAADAAQATLDALLTKRADAGNRTAAIAAERDAIAFEAHTDGGPAQKRLKELNLDAAMAAGELASLDAAVAEAKRRLQDAGGVLAAAKRRAAADHAADDLTKLQTLGDQIDAALTGFVDAVTAYDAVADKIHRAGFGGPGYANRRLHLENVVRFALTPLRLRNIGRPPGGAKSAGDLTAQWHQDIASRIASVLNPASVAPEPDDLPSDDDEPDVKAAKKIFAAEGSGEGEAA